MIREKDRFAKRYDSLKDKPSVLFFLCFFLPSSPINYNPQYLEIPKDIETIESNQENDSIVVPGKSIVYHLVRHIGNP
jgi:hypothetical protein